MKTFIDVVLERNGAKWALLSSEAVADPEAPGGFAATGPRKGATSFVDPVDLGGVSFPHHVRADWERTRDGLTVSMAVRTDPGNDPRAIWVEINAPRGLTGSDDRAIPLATFAKDSARALATGIFEPIRHAPRMTEEEKAERYRLVASAYKEAFGRDAEAITGELIAHGRKLKIWEVVQQILDDHRMPLSEDRINHLISEARRTKDPLTGETYLTATDPGRKKR